MRKILSLCAAMLVAYVANAAVINIDNTTSNALQAALNSAATGDIIEMAAGTYEESGNYLAFTGKELTVRAAEGAEVIIKTVCPVRLKESAKAEFINVKFDCSTIGSYEQVIVAADESANKRVVLTGCEFYGWAKNKAMIQATSSRGLAAITIDKCYFHDCMKSVVFVENTGAIDLSITNSTFANISTDAESFWAGVIDSRATSGSLLVDHCTFYNVQAMNTDYAAVGKVATPGAIVSNSIFTMPSSVDGVRAIRDVSEAKNCLTYNYIKDGGGIHSSVTKTNCVLNQDPLFVDAANGNFKLGDGSPALTMGTDGKAIGDPRWVPSAPAISAVPTEAAPVPTWPADQVVSLYSDSYTFAPTSLNSYNEGWWNNPTLTEETISENKYLHYNGRMTGMIGWQFADIAVTTMEYIHVDIWPSANTTLKMGPTTPNPNGDNFVASVAITVEAGKWNSIDIPVADLLAANPNFSLADVFQNQFTEYSALTDLSIDNVFFYRTTPYVDPTKPTDFTAVLAGNSYFSVTIKANAKDDSGAVSYDVVNGELIVATGSAASGVDANIVVNDLLPNTDYTFKVVAKDATGNATDPITVTAKTLAAPAPAAAPTYAEDNVFAIYTDVYTNHLGDIQLWYASPSIAGGSLSATSKALCIEPNTTDESCFGFAFAPTDITSYDALEMDVYATTAGVLTIQVIGVGEVRTPYNLVANQWNHIVLSIAGNTKTDCEQIGVYNCDKLAGTCFVQNVLFVKYVPAISLTQFITDKPATEVTLKDLTVIFASGSNTYVIDEEGVALVMYDKNKTYYDGTLTAGKVLSGQKATYTSYKNQDEIIPTNAVEATDGVAPTPTLLAEKPTTENVNRYISYKNVAAKANEGKYYIFEDVQLYGATGALKPTEDGNYDVEGIYILYNGTTPELIVTAIEKSSSTAINNAVVSEKAVKMIENGQLIIMKNGVKYNAQGAELR